MSDEVDDETVAAVAAGILIVGVVLPVLHLGIETLIALAGQPVTIFTEIGAYTVVGAVLLLLLALAPDTDSGTDVGDPEIATDPNEGN